MQERRRKVAWEQAAVTLVDGARGGWAGGVGRRAGRVGRKGGQGGRKGGKEG